MASQLCLKNALLEDTRFVTQHTTDVHMCSKIAFHMRKLPFAALVLVSCIRAAWHVLHMKVICASINKGWTACCSQCVADTQQCQILT